MELKELVESFGKHDEQFKELKKICDSEKESIKEMLTSSGKDEESAGEYKVVKSVRHTDSFNEEKAIEILKARGITSVIKTKEYIDMEALENAGYSGEVDKETLLKLDTCRTTKETVTLTCKKIKSK